MEKYLAHHGIKGQRWGIRRFQNSDGSLTAAGRERYGYSDSAKSKDLYERAKANAKVTDKMFYTKATIKNVKEIDDAGKYLSAKLAEAESAYDNYAQSLANNIRNFKNDKDTINSILDDLSNDFSSYDQVDDEELLDLVLDDYVDSYIYQQAKKQSAKEGEAFSKASEEYYSELDSVAKEIVGEYGDMPIATIKKGVFNKGSEITYKQAVDKTLKEMSDGWIDYLVRERDIAAYDDYAADALDEVREYIKDEWKNQ